MTKHLFSLWLLCLLCLLLAFSPAAAQDTDAPCGVADVVNMPVDTGVFTLAQDYGVASPRHQGRYHTGEDWHIGPGQSPGQPVRAIAAGRVTYASPIGWGRDGGVIIIEHTLPGGEIVYSQYGHIAESETATFPARLACVRAGDVIATIGDARPAPHLHFEIRVNQPDIPGPGYTRANPFDLGWRRPSQFVANRQAYAHPAHGWHYEGESALSAPPLVLNDASMMALDGDVLRGITYDGRVLWRVRLEREAVEIAGYQAAPYLVYTDGGITRIDYQGGAEARWSLDFAPVGPPVMIGDAPVYPTADGALVALTPERDAIVWRADGIPAPRRAYAADDLIGLVTADSRRIVFVSTGGDFVGEASLRDGASMATASNGDLLVYTAGGLWTVDASGVWALALPDVAPADAIPAGGGSAAVTTGDDGTFYLTDGESLYAYDGAGVRLWQTRLPLPLDGMTTLEILFGAVLLVTSRGHIVVADQGSGQICGFTQIYNDDRAEPWFDLAGDGVLRVAGVGQVIGLDWLRFAGACTDA